MRPSVSIAWPVVVWLLLGPGLVEHARACSCLRPTPEGSERNASVIFEGQVLEVKPVDPQQPGSGFEVSLRVVRSFKGARAERIRVWTAQDSAACGYAFAVGESHLVYASGDAEPYEVNVCNGTQPMAGAAEFLAALGMGEVPVDPPAAQPAQPAKQGAEPPARGGCAGCSVGAARLSRGPGGWAALGALALLLTRRRRRASSR